MLHKPYRVGFIGASPDRSWAALAHIPALKMLPQFQVAALSTTRRESAEAAGKKFDVPHVFTDHESLVNCDQVDIVAVTVKVPHHCELVMAALEAGKHVYCEWPLGNGLAEAEAMAAKAKQKGVHVAVGLQARAAPAIRYVKDLVAQGYVGEVLSTTLIGSGLNWGPAIDQANAYTADINNGATMLTIPLGHTLDALCQCLGQFTQVSATLANRRKEVLVVETNEFMPMTSHDQVIVDGTLVTGIPISVHYRGGSCRGTNLLWEINGTEGDLQVTSIGGHTQLLPLTIKGVNGDGEALVDLPIPASYLLDLPEQPQGFLENVAHAWHRFAQDIEQGTHLVPNFDDAVKHHRLIAAIEQAAATGQRQIFTDKVT